MNRKALEIARRKFGPKDKVTADATGNLAMDLAYEGKFPEAEAQFREVLQMDRNSFGTDDLKTFAAEGNLGAVLLQEENYQRVGERSFVTCWRRMRRVLGPTIPERC